jgi:FdhE protein
MKQQATADAAVEKITSALNAIEAENPHLKEVLQAFRDILLEQARWKAELPAQDCAEIAPPDPERFGKGVSLTDREWLSRLGDLWPAAAERMMPALIAGFPKIHQELVQLQRAILQGAFAPDVFLSAVFGGRTAEVSKQAELLGLATDLLVFFLTQAARPIVEKRAEMLAPLITGLTWHKGYCPICGSLPGLSLLKEKEGQRWLRCGFCASTWRFHRTACPFCDAQGPDDFELTYVEGREHERIEACQQCKKYLTGIDLRNLANEVVLEVAGFGLMHLDAIAQEKGYLPMNSGGPRISPSPDGAPQVS